MRNYKTEHGSLRKGLKQVHIGQDVWTFGKHKILDQKLHMVIYGPDRKEYHVWGDKVDSLLTEDKRLVRKNGSPIVFRHGNIGVESKVKIYILTSILDNSENWCFDLFNVPQNGPLKVICENGTVKNINFEGKFLPQELISKRFTDLDMGYSLSRWVNIVGYRKED